MRLGAQARAAMEPWERRKTESSRAYRAFCVYRDAGPDRSLNAAWVELRRRQKEPVDEGARAPGYFQLWSTAHDWVTRVAAWDAHLDAERRRAREARERELAERRMEFEFRNQDALEEQERVLRETLRKAAQAPLVEVNRVEQKGKTVIRTKVKGISLAGIARLAEARNETAAEAIVGVRKKQGEGGGAVTELVHGEFVWRPPAEGAD